MMMQKHRDLTLARLKQFRETLARDLYRDTASVRLAARAVDGRPPYAEAIAGDFEAIEVGHRFGPAWSTHWVRVDYLIPPAWAGSEVHLLWRCAAEGCAWVDGRPRQGLNEDPHTTLPLTRDAEGGETGSLYIEVACNGLMGVEENGPALRSSLGLLEEAVCGLFERARWDLLWDVTVVSELAAEAPASDPRGAAALHTANEIANRYEPNDPDSWHACREVAKSFLATRPGEGRHRITAIGHAHIDTAWLWPPAETRRKCCRSFSTALSLMREYPDYRLVCSQARQWLWMKEQYPDLYRDMREAAARGQFLPVGGTWVEPDCNLPSGESLVRQFLYGQRFFQRETGTRSEIFWNPDVFGYSGQLPQIMAGAGIRYFLTQKISWNQFNSFPHHSFLWEGIDGTRILTHFPPADTYNGDASVREILYSERNFKDHAGSRDSLYLFGIGDGGGGPSREMLEQIRRMKNVDGLPPVEIADPQRFFDRLAGDADRLQTWVGELYLELHRGTYTTHARTKRSNRLCERMLHDLELLEAVAPPPGADRGAEALWREVLLNQFHDILPGSSIAAVYEDAAGRYEAVWAEGGARLDAALTALAGKPGPRILAVNTRGFPRREVVELPPGVSGVRQVGSGGERLGIVSAPSLGYSAGPAEHDGPEEVSARREGDRFLLENSRLRAAFSADGLLVSLWDKAAHRDVLPPGETANQLVLYDDRPVNWDAWDIDAFHEETKRPPAKACEAGVEESGPLRACLRFEFALGTASRMSQRVRLTALSRRLDFICDVDWQEAHTLLRAECPVGIRAMEAAYEIQFGHIRRPTHANTSWDMARFEVCAQRWADLSEHGYGVALLNDCKYGYAIRGNRLRLSLLRSPKSPDPNADMGPHHFTYALLPHEGTPQDGGVLREAAALNHPLHLAPTAAGEAEVSWFAVDSPGIVIDTVKRAEDSGDLVVRLYEAHGGHAEARLTSSLPVAGVRECSLLEDDGEELTWTGGGVDLSFRPFQIRSLKLART